MSSTAEVGCIGDDFSEALLNAMIATGFRIPRPEEGRDVLLRSHEVQGGFAGCQPHAFAKALQDLCYGRYSRFPQRPWRDDRSRLLAG